MATQRAECIVSGPLAFMLHISRAVGVAPLQFKRSFFVWRICVSPAANLYGIVLTISLCCLAFAAFLINISLARENLYDLDTKTDLAIYECLFTLIILICFGLVWSVTGTNRMKCMIECLNTIQTINLKLDDYCSSTKSDKASWQLIAFSLIQGILIFCLTHVSKLYEESASPNKVALSIMYLSNIFMAFARLVLIIHITIIIMIPLSTLKRLNTCLEVLLQKINCEDSNDLRTSQRDIEEAVCNLARMHVNICGVIRQMDKSYSFVYIGFVFSLFLHLMIALYRCLNNSAINDEVASFTQIILILWVIFHTSCLIIIVEPCHRTQEEVVNTKRIIRRMLSKVPTSDHVLNNELGRFFSMLTLKQVRYSPMSMITLDRSLYVSVIYILCYYYNNIPETAYIMLVMVASITTYLVIVMEL